jgi:hypothetical protein
MAISDSTHHLNSLNSSSEAPSNTLAAEFFKVVVRFSRFMLLPELARFPAQDSDLLAL